MIGGGYQITLVHLNEYLEHCPSSTHDIEHRHGADYASRDAVSPTFPVTPSASNSRSLDPSSPLGLGIVLWGFPSARRSYRTTTQIDEDQVSLSRLIQ